MIVRSQAGHQVVLDDSASGPKITISDSTGALSIEFDATGQSITINASTGNVALKAPAGKLSLQAASIDITSTGAVSVQGGTSVAVKGQMVQIN